MHDFDRRGAGCAVLLLSCALSAQSSFSPHVSMRGATSSDSFGRTMTVLPDLDGDGCDEVAVGLATRNRVEIYSGRTGLELFRTTGPHGDFYGDSVVSVGDVDADGVPDFAVGASETTRPGYVTVESGRTGARLLTFANADTDTLRFGFRMACAGDFDGDGVNDVVVSYRGVAARFNEVRVGIYSLRTGQLLLADPTSRVVDGAFGVGDVDDDGFDDVAVGYSSGFHFLSGRTRRTLVANTHSFPSRRFGAAMAATDFNGNGRRDLVVGLPGAFGVGQPGDLLVYKGTTERLMTQQLSSVTFGYFGTALALADFDGDGLEDIAVSEPGHQFGTVIVGQVRIYAHRGGDTVEIARLQAPIAGDEYGTTLATGDFNGDGRPDLAIGAPGASELVPRGGRVTLLLNGASFDPGRWQPYGIPCPDRFGRHPRGTVSSQTVTGEPLVFNVRSAPFDALSVVDLGVARASLSLQPVGAPGCELALNPLAIMLTRTDFTGRASASLPIPADPTLVGGQLTAQWFVVDPVANPLGLAGSQGVAVRLGGG
ncbi:MAG: VCBS repeat-containing protein [Planctomycetota bacterium]